MIGRPLKMRVPESSPGKGAGWGSSCQLCSGDGSHCPQDRTGGQGPDGRQALLIGVTLRLSAKGGGGGGLHHPWPPSTYAHIHIHIHTVHTRATNCYIHTTHMHILNMFDLCTNFSVVCTAGIIVCCACVTFVCWLHSMNFHVNIQ